MKSYYLLLLLTAFPACRTAGPGPSGQLPPATQVGSSTFGCLLNGQVWVPGGHNGTANFQATYDADYQGGALQLKAYRYVGPAGNTLQSLTLGVAGVRTAGQYAFYLTGSNGISYSDFGQAGACSYYSGTRLSQRTGVLTISRLDLQAGVVAGTFDFVLAQPGCDTIRVTQGRFDAHL